MEHKYSFSQKRVYAKDGFIFKIDNSGIAKLFSHLPLRTKFINDDPTVKVTKEALARIGEEDRYFFVTDFGYYLNTFKYGTSQISLPSGHTLNAHRIRKLYINLLGRHE